METTKQGSAAGALSLSAGLPQRRSASGGSAGERERLMERRLGKGCQGITELGMHLTSAARKTPAALIKRRPREHMEQGDFIKDSNEPEFI